jgi:hypothetical protein
LRAESRLLDMSRIESGRLALRKEESPSRTCSNRSTLCRPVPRQGLNFDCRILGHVRTIYRHEMKLKQCSSTSSPRRQIHRCTGEITINVEPIARYGTIPPSASREGHGHRHGRAYLPALRDASPRRFQPPQLVRQHRVGHAIAKNIWSDERPSAVTSQKGVHGVHCYRHAAQQRAQGRARELVLPREMRCR